MVTVNIEEREIIDRTICECRECFVAMIDTEGFPYVIPMNFGYEKDTIYLHSAPIGKCIQSLEKNSNVCITFCTESQITHQNKEVACSYRIQGSSVICQGKVEFLEDLDEKKTALNILMKHYTNQPFDYSEPAVKNVKIWRVEIKNVSAKIFGVPYKESHRYK